jgi:hypothetical protein
MAYCGAGVLYIPAKPCDGGGPGGGAKWWPCAPGGFVCGSAGAYAPNAAKGVDMVADHGEGTKPAGALKGVAYPVGWCPVGGPIQSADTPGGWCGGGP